MIAFSAVNGKELVAALVRAGFAVIRIKGSHHFLRHADGRTTVIPAHSGESIGPGLLASILRDTKITRESLQKLLR